MSLEDVAWDIRQQKCLEDALSVLNNALGEEAWGHLVDLIQERGVKLNIGERDEKDPLKRIEQLQELQELISAADPEVLNRQINHPPEDKTKPQ